MAGRFSAIAAACGMLAAAGCPSLDALECHGVTCTDGSASDAPPAEAGSSSSSSSSSSGGASGIFCGAGQPTCTAPSHECCLNGAGTQTSCTTTSGCNGSDIFCDDPSQCSDGGPCWICVNGQGFQGTSCDYQGDIVDNDHCNSSNALQLCHSSSQCQPGTTCRPLAVDGFDAGAGASWFQACQSP